MNTTFNISEFHRSRQAFILHSSRSHIPFDNRPIYQPHYLTHDTSLSHWEFYQYLQSIYSVENFPDSQFELDVRGFASKDNNLYLYYGDFFTPELTFLLMFKAYEITLDLYLDPKITPVYGGLHKLTPGKQWEPIKYFGTSQELYNQYLHSLNA